MKAVIVEIDGKYAVALSKNGDFIKIKNKEHYKVGCEVDIPKTAGFDKASVIKRFSIAAAFFLVMGIGAGAYSYSMPYSYINVDINPSIEFTANMYNRIIDAKGLNEEGNRLLSLQNYKNKTIRESIETVLELAYEQGYLQDSLNNAVVFALSGKNQNKVEKIQKEIETAADQKLQKVENETEVVVEKLQEKQHNDAKEQGISPAKMLLINKLKEVKPEIEIDDVKDNPVNEIIKSIKDAEKDAGKAAKAVANKKDAKKDGKELKAADKDKEEKKDNKKNNGKDSKKDDKKDNKKDNNKNNKKEDKKDRKENNKNSNSNADKNNSNKNKNDKDKDNKNKDQKDKKGNKNDDKYNKISTQNRGGQVRISISEKTSGWNNISQKVKGKEGAPGQKKINKNNGALIKSYLNTR